MNRLTALVLTSFLLSLFIAGSAAAQLRFPEHVEVIEPPTDRTYDDFGAGLSLRGSLLMISGYFHGDGCAPLGTGSCPVINLYERRGDTWQRIRSIVIAEGGLADGALRADSFFAVSRFMSGNAGAPRFKEVTTWRFDDGSGEWLPDPPIRHFDYESAAITEELMLIAFQYELAFYEYVNGEWVETGPRLFAQDAYSTNERLTYGGIVIDGGYAYVSMCREPRSCAVEHKIAVIDLATRSYTDTIDIAPFAEPNPAYSLRIIGDRMAVKKPYSNTSSTYEPIKLYSRIAGVWQQTHESHLTLSPEAMTVSLTFDGSTMMEEFTQYLYHSYSTYIVIYRPDARGGWMETGRIIFPGGDEFLSSVSPPAVWGNAAVFAHEPEGPGLQHVLYIEDYEYYLDTDQDGMPVGWEERYSFSDDSYDDFTRDSDEDGLADRDEFVLITSPVEADTDGDLMPDGWEVDALLDPTDGSDANADLDADGYDALAEYEAGTDPLDSSSKPAPPDGSDAGGENSSGGGSADLALLLCLMMSTLLFVIQRRLPQQRS